MNRKIYSVSVFISLCTISLLILAGCSKEPILVDSTGSFTDSRDNKTYSWAKVGTQVWMTENLAYLNSVSPSAEGSDTTAYSYVYYYESTFVNTARENTNYLKYGALYNWPAAKLACPDGWHLPSDAEYTVLGDYLGGDSVAGTKMKSESGWSDKGNGDNSSGFNGFPGGYRNKAGGFFLLEENAGFWTATAYDSTDAWVRDLGYDYGELGRNPYAKTGGFSLRCVRN